MFIICLFSGCQESYEDKENCYACIAGCKSQDVILSPDSFMEVNKIFYKQSC